MSVLHSRPFSLSRDSSGGERKRMLRTARPPPPDEERKAAVPPSSPSLDDIFDHLPPLVEWKWSPIPAEQPSAPPPSSVASAYEAPKLATVFAPNRRPRSSTCRRTPLTNPWLGLVIPSAAAAVALPGSGSRSSELSDSSGALSDQLRSSGITSDAIHSCGDENEMETESRRAKLQGGGRRLPEEPLKVLRAWLAENMADPYPSRWEKQRLARSSGLRFKQVANWISNARGKLKLRRGGKAVKK